MGNITKKLVVKPNYELGMKREKVSFPARNVTLSSTSDLQQHLTNNNQQLSTMMNEINSFVGIDDDFAETMMMDVGE